MTAETALTSLVTAIESSLADLVSAMERASEGERTAGIERLLSAIESGIADIAAGAGTLSAIEAGLADIAQGVERQIDLSGVVAAIRAIKPATVNVKPTPITVQVTPSVPVVQIIDRNMAGAKWRVSMPGIDGEPARVMTIERTA